MSNFELVLVTSKDEAYREALSNLTKMYCCEWSRYNGVDMDERGRYRFEDYLPLYWQRADRAAYLLRHTGEDGKAAWAGFALLDRDFILHKDADRSLAEFFVVPKYRRCGAGRWMAEKLFDLFPGKWELGRHPKNAPSVAFWDSVVAWYTRGDFDLVKGAPEHRFFDGTLGDVFYFDNGVK